MGARGTLYRGRRKGRTPDVWRLFRGLSTIEWYGVLKPELAVVGTKLKVKILNEFWEAEVVEDSPYDPKNARIRVEG